MADRISFTSYQAPGVYTQTLLSSEGINLSAGYRIPTFIGPADVLIENNDVPVVRGSSKNFPVFVEREDVSAQATGSNSIFKTKLGPIVDPITFLATENTENVIISVNDKSTNALLITPENTEGRGEVHFTFSPDSGDEVFISYYYIVEDKPVVDENLSEQILTGAEKTFYTKNRKVVDSEGDVTNDVTDITVKVNGQEASVSTLNGTTGQFVLAVAPSLGATLVISYTYSNHIDNNDPLPNKYIHSITKVGDVPGRKDYVNGVDYNFSFERSVNDTTFHEIAWGNSFALTSMQEEDENFQYDWIPGDHITVDLFDRPIFAEVATPVDLTGSPLTTAVFKVSRQITDGTGKGTFLFDPDTDPGIFDFYVGADINEALPGGASTDGNRKWGVATVDSKVIRIDGNTGYIYLDKPVDPLLDNLYVIYRTSFMSSDKFTLSKTATGKYSMFSPNTGYAPSVVEGTHSITPTLTGGLFAQSETFLENTWKDRIEAKTSGNVTSASFPNFFDMTAGLTHSQDETIKVEVTDVTGQANSVYKFEVTSVLTDEITKAGATGSDVAINTAYANTTRATIKKNEGYSGETYIDPTTGFQFNIVIPPGLSVNEYFTFKVSRNGVFDLQDSGASTARVEVVIPGVTLLADEVDSVLTIGDEVILDTYDNAGAEPNVGDTYYVTYKYFRTDFKHRLYTRLTDVVRDFGLPNLSNPLALAAKVAFENGTPVVGLKPLPRYTDSTFKAFLATEDLIINPDSATAIQLFKDAFDDIELPFDTSSEARPYVVVPLSDDSQVWSYGKAHVEKMSSIERRMNRYLITGFNTNRKDSLVTERAKNLISNRMMITYPVSAVKDVETSSGVFTPAVVPGWFYGAGIAGLIGDPGTSPSDPLLNKSIQGFKETGISKNPLEYNQIAKEGVTIFVTKNPLVKVRDDLNTDMSSVLTKNPAVTFIADFVENQTELVMNTFVGRPFINTILGAIETKFSAFLQELQRAGIIFSYDSIEVRENENDRTIIELSAGYVPVLGVKHIFVTYRIQGS
jgi:hypothetical protein